MASPFKTVRYGPARDQVADLRYPGGDGPFGVAVVIHGGFWRAEYTRRIMDPFCIALGEAGWATWNVEYRRLGTGGGIPETLDDVAAAVAALGSDGAVAVGHSAGGHLALWLGGTAAVGGVVALGAVCDLAAAAREGLGGGAAAELAGGMPDDRPDAYDLADPARRLPAQVPQILVHGSADDRVPIEQSRAYAERARAAGDRCELVELEGTGHFELIDPRAREWSDVVAALARLRS